MVNGKSYLGSSSNLVIKFKGYLKLSNLSINNMLI